jgi:hypothetical protein
MACCSDLFCLLCSPIFFSNPIYYVFLDFVPFHSFLSLDVLFLLNLVLTVALECCNFSAVTLFITFHQTQFSLYSVYYTVLGAFEKLRNATISFAMSIHLCFLLSACNKSDPSGGI